MAQQDLCGVTYLQHTGIELISIFLCQTCVGVVPYCEPTFTANSTLVNSPTHILYISRLLD